MDVIKLRVRVKAANEVIQVGVGKISDSLGLKMVIVDEMVCLSSNLGVQELNKSRVAEMANCSSVHANSSWLKYLQSYSAPRLPF